MSDMMHQHYRSTVLTNRSGYRMPPRYKYRVRINDNDVIGYENGVDLARLLARSIFSAGIKWKVFHCFADGEEIDVTISFLGFS